MERRLGTCAFSLDNWSRRIRREMKGGADRYKALMDLYKNSHDTYSSNCYLEAYHEYTKALLKEDTYWKQRAKMHWLRDGDLNTKFFHMSATARRNFRKKLQLNHEDGRSITDMQE